MILPNWFIEISVAAIGSVIGGVIYAVILIKYKEKRSIIEKTVNIALAIATWASLFYDKMQQVMNDMKISFNESTLFYVAVAFAVASLVHSIIELTER